MKQSFILIRSEKHKTEIVCIHKTEETENEAKLAFALIERWSMVAIPDGEDSSGRSKLRLITVEELTERAFETAKSAFQRARDNGLMHQVGLLKDFN